MIRFYQHLDLDETDLDRLISLLHLHFAVDLWFVRFVGSTVLATENWPVKIDNICNIGALEMDTNIKIKRKCIAYLTTYFLRIDCVDSHVVYISVSTMQRISLLHIA